MENEKIPKEKKKFNLLIIYVIGFIISIFFEFYWISYYPYDYFMLFGIGIILCIFGYLSIDGILDMVQQTIKKRDEQNELMIKASKAIYLTTKKMALETRRSADTQSSKDSSISELVDNLTNANERLAKEVEYAVSIRSLVQDNEKIVKNVRAAMEQPLSPMELERSMNLDESITETDFDTISVLDSNEELSKEDTSIDSAEETSPVTETISIDSAEEASPVTETISIDSAEEASPAAETISIDSTEETSPATASIDSADTENVETEPELDYAHIMSEISAEAESALASSTTDENETPEMTENTIDENKQLSPEEIEALFANL